MMLPGSKKSKKINKIRTLSIFGGSPATGSTPPPTSPLSQALGEEAQNAQNASSAAALSNREERLRQQRFSVMMDSFSKTSPTTNKEVQDDFNIMLKKLTELQTQTHGFAESSSLAFSSHGTASSVLMHNSSVGFTPPTVTIPEQPSHSKAKRFSIMMKEFFTGGKSSSTPSTPKTPPVPINSSGSSHQLHHHQTLSQGSPPNESDHGGRGTSFEVRDEEGKGTSTIRRKSRSVGDFNAINGFKELQEKIQSFDSGNHSHPVGSPAQSPRLGNPLEDTASTSPRLSESPNPGSHFDPALHPMVGSTLALAVQSSSRLRSASVAQSLTPQRSNSMMYSKKTRAKSTVNQDMQHLHQTTMKFLHDLYDKKPSEHVVALERKRMKEMGAFSPAILLEALHKDRKLSENFWNVGQYFQKETGIAKILSST